MTEMCKSNPCCGNYRNCKEPPQFKQREGWDAYKARTAAPAASHAETQGGDGVREANVIPIKMADGKGGWTIDPETLEAIADKVNGDGWDCGQWEGIQGVLLAVGAQALAPSTSAATRGDDQSLRHETGERITRKDLNNAYRKGAEDGRLATRLIDGMWPAPAVESAQVKVKPLVWRARTSLHHCAETPFGSYSAYVDGGWKGPSSSGNAGGSFPEGRAAAEAQHQHDIRASLDLATDAEG